MLISKIFLISYLIAGYHSGYKGVGPSVLVHVGSVHLLREPWFLVVLVLRVDPHSCRAGPRRLPLVLRRHLELVVGVVAVRVQPPLVGDETIRVDSKAVIRDMIGNVGITAAVCITRLHSQDGGSDGDVLVNVVSLIFCSIRWLYTL